MEMDRMRIAFFLNNFYEKDIDFSHPENGNPGIRGTEYMIWQIACKLSELLPEVYLFSYYIHLYSFHAGVNKGIPMPARGTGA